MFQTRLALRQTQNPFFRKGFNFTRMASTETENKFIQIPKGKIHYHEWGRKDNEKVIIMLHGSLQTWHTWDNFGPRVCEDYRVIAFDQRGHGESFHSSSQDYSTQSMVQDLEQVVETLNISSFDLIGMSMGAANSLLYTSTHPTQVKSLVMVDWVPTIDLTSLKILSNMASESWKSFDEAVEYMKERNPSRTEQNLRDRLKYALCQKGDIWTWKSDIAGLLSRTEKTAYTQQDYVDMMWNQVPLVQCPLLLLKGEESGFITMENANKMKKLVQNENCSVVVVPKAGHSIQGDNPEFFFKTVTEFLKKNK